MRKAVQTQHKLKKKKNSTIKKTATEKDNYKQTKTRRQKEVRGGVGGGRGGKTRNRE